MDLSEDLKNNPKKLSGDILFGKPSDCKHCCGVSAGVFGVHYACMNKNYKGYGMQPPLCLDCDGYEKEDNATTEQ